MMSKAFNAPAGWAVPADAATIDALVAEMMATPVDEKPHRWAVENTAAFGRVKEEWGQLSNMANGLSFVDPATGLHWGSSEAWYQAQRFPEDQAHQRAIMRAPHAYVAKEVAYQKIDASRGDWKRVKVEMMARALVLKATNPAFVAVLDATGGMAIVEKSWRDAFWGAKPVDGAAEGDKNGAYVGANVLGQLEIRLREAVGRLLEKQQAQRPARPSGGGMASALRG